MRLLVLLVGFLRSSASPAYEERCAGYSDALIYLSRCVMIGSDIDQTEQEILTTSRNYPELSCPCFSNIPDLFPTCADQFQPSLECEGYGVQQVQISIRDQNIVSNHDEGDKEKSSDDKDDHRDEDKGDHDDKDNHRDEDGHDDKGDHDDKDSQRDQDDKKNKGSEGEGDQSGESNGISLTSSDVVLISVGCAIFAGIVFAVLMKNQRFRSTLPQAHTKVTAIPMVEPHLTVLAGPDSIGVSSLVIATPLHVEIDHLDEENSAY